MTYGMFLILLGTCFHVLFLAPRKGTTCPVNYYFASLTGNGLLAGLLIWGATAATGNHAGSLGSLPVLLAGIVLGIIWGIASFSYICGAELIGVSRATALKNLTAIVGLVLGVLCFGEFRHAGWFKLSLALLGCGLMVGSGMTLAQTLPQQPQRVKAGRQGIGFSLTAAFFFAFYAAGVKAVSPAPIPVSLIPLMTAAGGFISALTVLIVEGGLPAIADWIKMPFRDHWRSSLSGVIWLAGTFCIAGGIKLVGVGVSWSVVPIGTLVSVMLGIVLLQEIDIHRYRQNLLFGMSGSLGAFLILLWVSRMG